MHPALALLTSLAGSLQGPGSTGGPIPEAGLDRFAAFPAAVALDGSLSGAAPLVWSTADGNGASEDMLVRYDEASGQVAVGLLTDGAEVHGWLGDLVEVDGALVGNSVLKRELFTVDRLTGACAYLAGPFDARYSDVHSLAYDPEAGRLFAVDMVERQLLVLDLATGAALLVGNRTLGAYPLVRALAWDAAGGRLLAIDQQSDALIAIDPATGAPTFLTTVAPYPDVRQEELASFGGALYMNLGVLVGGVMDRARLQRLDPLTGATLDLGPELTSVSGHALHVESVPERVRWEQRAGPGLVAFSDPTAAVTTASASQPGSYLLELAVLADDGSVLAFDTVTVVWTGLEVFCAGDEAGAGCPCGNPGSLDEGCRNSTGGGGRLAWLGSTSASADDGVLEASQLPVGKAGIFLAGAFAKNGGLGTPFGDGLRCVQGPPLWRYPLSASGPDGVMRQGSVTELAKAAIAAGDTWLFQAWHRDDDSTCGTRTNLTAAIAVTFGP